MTDPTRTEAGDPDERAARRARWDARHAAAEAIESSDPDPVLVSLMRDVPPGRALDLGAGDGRNAVWLASRGWAVTAVDFSSVALDRARSLAAAAGVELELMRADLAEVELEPAAFELVLLLFIHLPPTERRAVHARAAAAVAPGGRLLVVAHDRSNLSEGLGGPQDPAVLFSSAEVAPEFPGLRIERTETRRRPDPSGRAPIDAVLLARRDSSATD